jgi:hypothetical protein
MGRQTMAGRSTSRSVRPPGLFVIIASALAFGPLALGLAAHVLNVFGIVSEQGTGDLFAWAPIVALFACPAALIVLGAGIFPHGGLGALTAAGLIVLIGPGSCVAYYGYWERQWSYAKAEAARFCDSATPGSDLSSAVARARNREMRVREGTRDGEDYAVVTFLGPTHNAVSCELRATDAKIVSAVVTELLD